MVDLRIRPLALGLGALGLFAVAHPAQATENAASLYLLGSGGPGTAVMPPLQGVYLDSFGIFDDMQASAEKQFPFNGSVLAGVTGKIGANFTSVLWVPSTNVLGGTLGVGAIAPFGVLKLDAAAVITGPRGRQIGASVSESRGSIGDPVGVAELGWKFGDWSVQAADLLNVPIGMYDHQSLANLAFHRWANDVSLAGAWHDDKSGWDVTGKLGVTFNGANEATHYTTGTELHLEGSVAKEVAKNLWIGVQAYYFDQLSGDSGTGAKLGPFKGRVAGAGATAAYSFVAGMTPMTIRVRGMSEFDVRNRLAGQSAWLEISLPLSMKLPAPAR